MPRDKTDSHEKIVKAAMKEFLEKGYEQASMKSVADAVGMTSAALYRHFESKQAMFAALVQPGIEAMREWTGRHLETSYAMFEEDDRSRMWEFGADMNDAKLVLDVMYAQPDVFRLLISCSAGTPYENIIHDTVEEATDHMMLFVKKAQEHGFKVRNVQRDEMHLLVSAYSDAMLQPIVHGYSKEDAKRCLKTVIEFFTPGWRMVTGM